VVRTKCETENVASRREGPGKVGSSGSLATPMQFAEKIILPPMNADKACASQVKDNPV
jgi:hypothetical protein